MANEPIPTNGDRPNQKFFERFLDNQTRELALKAQELELEKQREQNNTELSRAALEAQERDRAHERDSRRNERKDRHKAALGFLLIIAVLIGAAIYLGAKDIGIELIKSVGLLVAGAFGGYGYAKSKPQQDEE